MLTLLGMILYATTDTSWERDGGPAPVGLWALWIGLGTLFLFGITFINFVPHIWYNEWVCQNCNKVYTEQEVISNSTASVQSVTNTVKHITSHHNSQTVGLVGNQRVVMNTPQTSTSTIPIIVGSILATHVCEFPPCSSKFQWHYTSEVQPWNDINTGQTTYQIIGNIRPPHM
jgi:hypothetical protein